MKKLILLALVLFSAATMLAQTNRMSYQAVVRNAANELVAEENLTVAIRISDANGTSAFSETHSVTSNRNGVISLMIGEGSGQSGNMASVDWRTAQIHTEVTLPGGATLSNTTQVNAVPYAFYADSVDIHWVNDVVDEYLENHDISSIVETDPTVPAWAKEATKPVYDYSEITNTPTIPTNVGELTNDANYITLEQVPAQVNADWNATTGAAQILNKPELFSGDYNDLTNKPTIPTVPTNVSEFNNDAEYVTTNQLNAANYITAADVPAQVNADWNATEGSAQILNKPELFSGDYNDLTNTPTIPTVPANVSEFTNDAHYIANTNVSCTDAVDLCELLEKLEQLENQLEFRIQTEGVTAVTQHSFMVNGNVITNGTTVSQRGFVYSSSNPTPTLSDSHVNSGTGTGTFTSTITGLDAGMTYYVRAYATNQNGTFYGSVVAVTTTATSPSTLPSVTTITVTNITTSEATVKGAVTSDGGENVTQRGFVYDTLSNPTTSSTVVYHGTGTGQFSNLLSSLHSGKTYYVRAFATNSLGTAYGNQLTFVTSVPTPVEGDAIPCPGAPTVTDHEGNVYNTVQIGTQCWTKENMRATTSPSTGTYLIPPAGTTYTYTGKQACWYNNDSATYAQQNYGLLYNWNAAVDTYNIAYGETSVQPATGMYDVTFTGHRRGICPKGWHVPSDAEWTMLTDYLNSHAEYRSGGFDGYIAQALAFTNGWFGSSTTYAVGNNPSTHNATGFSAVPAGVCSGSLFHGAGDHAHFWSSTQTHSHYAHYLLVRIHDAVVFSVDEFKYVGYSVRCLRDTTGGSTVLTEPTVTTSDATDVTETSATLNGSISNPDNVAITTQGFEWKATSGGAYVAVNATGETMTYNLTGLTAGTSYTYRAFVTTAEGTNYGGEVEFTTTSSAPTVFTCGTSKMVDADGNEYETVLIGTQCWTKTNLRVAPAGATDATSSGATSITEPYYYVNSAVNPAVYGYYYNGEAAKLACPTGWHLPSDAEWTVLTDYVSSQSEYTCGGNSSYIAKALASTEGWNTYTDNCVVGNDPSTNNATGFSAVPAGYCYVSSFLSSFLLTGDFAEFWSSTQHYSGNAYTRYLGYGDALVYRNVNAKRSGRSVRCLRD